MKKNFVVFFIICCIMIAMANENKPIKILFDTTLGTFEVEVYPDVAPMTVKNFVDLSKQGYYDGVIFHRVIDDFMIQGGDPTGTGRGGESIWKKGFRDEISAKALGLDKKMAQGTNISVQKALESQGYSFNDELPSMHCKYGTLCMANAGPNTNGSQFFIVVKDECSWLDGKHTVFGKVVENMDVVDKIASTKVDAYDRPIEKVVINKVKVID